MGTYFFGYILEKEWIYRENPFSFILRNSEPSLFHAGVPVFSGGFIANCGN